MKGCCRLELGLGVTRLMHLSIYTGTCSDWFQPVQSFQVNHSCVYKFLGGGGGGERERERDRE